MLRIQAERIAAFQGLFRKSSHSAHGQIRSRRRCAQGCLSLPQLLVPKATVPSFDVAPRRFPLVARLSR